MGRPAKYAPELRERAVRLVFEHAGEYASQWAAIRSVAEKIEHLDCPARRSRCFAVICSLSLATVTCTEGTHFPRTTAPRVPLLQRYDSRQANLKRVV